MASLLLLVLASSAALTNAFDWSVCPLVGGTCTSYCPEAYRTVAFLFGTNYPLCPGEKKHCCLRTDTSMCYNDEQCGKYTVLPSGRSGFPDGPEARGSAPWQVSMRRVNVEGTSDPMANSFHLGAGVLFHREWVVTDCTLLLNIGKQSASETILRKLLLVFGEYDLLVPETYQNKPQEQMRTAQKVIFQSGYRFQSGETYVDLLIKAGIDLAVLYQAKSICLVKLSEPVEITDWVKPICLPEPDVCTTNVNCRITAWGLDENDYLKRRLQVTQVKHFSKAACEAIDNYRTGIYSLLPQNTRCALNEKSSFSCAGDFGGPLTCYNPQNELRATLEGIMTYSLPCNKEIIRISDIPSVVSWMWDTCVKE